MPSIPTIIQQRRERHQHAQNSASQQLLKILPGFGFIFSCALVIAILAGAWYYADLTRNLPAVENLPILLNPENGTLLQPTRLFDRNGQQLIYTIAPDNETRTFITYSDLPADLVNATLVLADPGLWKHPGFLLEDWRDPDRHATIAQKLASDMLLYDEPASTRRSLRERLLAGQITAQFGREKVMEWYLNSAYYGHQAYGIQAAAQFYFGIPASDLNLSQAAMLAAVSQAPALNPVDTPQFAEQRRLETLQIMLAFNLSDADQVTQAGGSPPVINQAAINSVDERSAFTRLVLTQLGAKFNRERIERGGLIILTTMDLGLQSQVDCSLKIQLIRLGAAIETPQAECPAGDLLPPLPPGVTANGNAANALVLDVTNGQVLAISGQGSTNHPAGTILTPFIYLTGFTRGLSPSSLGWDIPGKQIEFDQVYRGPVTLRNALVHDYLEPALQIETQMGAENTWNVAHLFGLQGKSASLLSSDVTASVMEVAGAYATFSNQGIMTGQAFQTSRPEPYSVLKLSSVDNVTWGEWSFPEKQAVVSPGLAYLVNQVLSDETAYLAGEGQAHPFGIERPAAFKLGRSLDGSGTWAVGYTPQRLVLVWLEGDGNRYDLPVTLPAAGLWRAFMLTGMNDLPRMDWEVPKGIVHVFVCAPSGMLPSPACPNLVNEIFLQGNEPIQTDTLYQTYLVNQETGFLATVFTPSELVEKRVYVNLPPSAESWAKDAGIPLAPHEYDTILQPAPLENAHISSPALFADVGGILEIKGSASGAHFSYYRVDYGVGLNPQEWVQIGAASTRTVEEGSLSTWDTRSINGLVALRLMVVHDDQSIEIAVTQLLVDNTPPQIRILSPKEGEEFNSSSEQGIVLETQVNDSNLTRVRIYVDNENVADLVHAPFSLVWQEKPGTHTMKVIATDRAGNQSELIIHFRVKP